MIDGARAGSILLGVGSRRVIGSSLVTITQWRTDLGAEFVLHVHSEPIARRFTLRRFVELIRSTLT